MLPPIAFRGLEGSRNFSLKHAAQYSSTLTPRGDLGKSRQYLLPGHVVAAAASIIPLRANWHRFESLALEGRSSDHPFNDESLYVSYRILRINRSSASFISRNQ
jgi:hypothetical protein